MSPNQRKHLFAVIARSWLAQASGRCGHGCRAERPCLAERLMGLSHYVLARSLVRPQDRLGEAAFA